MGHIPVTSRLPHCQEHSSLHTLTNPCLRGSLIIRQTSRTIFVAFCSQEPLTLGNETEKCNEEREKVVACVELKKGRVQGFRAHFTCRCFMSSLATWLLSKIISQSEGHRHIYIDSRLRACIEDCPQNMKACRVRHAAGAGGLLPQFSLGGRTSKQFELSSLNRTPLVIPWNLRPKNRAKLECPGRNPLPNSLTELD